MTTDFFKNNKKRWQIKKKDRLHTQQKLTTKKHGNPKPRDKVL